MRSLPCLLYTSFLTVDALEALAARALELGCDDAAIVDPFDSQKSSDVLHGACLLYTSRCV